MVDLKKVNFLILEKLVVLIQKMLAISSHWEINMEKHTFSRGGIYFFKKGSKGD